MSSVTCTFPIGNEVIDPGVEQTFTWDHVPVPDDPKYEQEQQSVYYKKTGASAWTNVPTKHADTNEYHVYAASTFDTASEYQWYVYTYDSNNVRSESPVAFFTTSSAPTAPTITDPAAAATITTATYAIVWTADADLQTHFQARRVADAAGSPNTAIVYEDSGEIASSAGRTYTFTLDANSRDEHWQVRIKYGGVWSTTWHSHKVTIGWTEPDAPAVTVTASSANGYITCKCDHGGDNSPAVDHFDVYRTEDSEVASTAIRVKASLADGGTYTDYDVASGKVYRYYGRAFTATGEWVNSALTA